MPGIDSKQVSMWARQIASAFLELEREADMYAGKAEDFEEALNGARAALRIKHEKIKELEAEVARLDEIVKLVPRYEMLEVSGGE